MNLVLSVLIGGGLGAALGYFGKCSSGTCPFTANWWRGALYGAVVGFLFHAVSARNSSNSSESTPNVSLVQEQQFEAEIAQASRPVVVDFFATWCGPCKRLSPILDELAGPLVNQISFLKVDVDQSPGLAQRYGIQGVPTLLFLRDGKVVGREVGLTSKDELRARLSSLLSSGGSLGEARS